MEPTRIAMSRSLNATSSLSVGMTSKKKGKGGGNLLKINTHSKVLTGIFFGS